jgi:hypothetical protein
MGIDQAQAMTEEGMRFDQVTNLRVSGDRECRQLIEQ